jgi:sec-independent protein translocase protein TatC
MANKFTKTGTSEMPFLDHLEELRWRVLWSLLAVIVCTIGGWLLVTRLDVLGILIEPIKPFLGGTRLKYLVTVGLVLASPIIVYQIWAFLAPALLPSEKRVIVPALYMGLVLFGAGVWMAYEIALPMTLRFTMGFQTASLEQAIVIGAYLSVVTRLLLAFGLIFELPVVVLILSALGLVTPEFLVDKRRHAIAMLTVAAAVLTPGDVITLTLMMMVPLVLLYELSIILSRLVTRRRTAAAAAAAAAEASVET